MEISGKELLWAKVKSGAKIPTKNDEDSGFDVYACFDELYKIIEPHKTVKIPCGIASAVPKGYGIILKERGSTGSLGIAQRSGVIDSGYRGEWDCPITNTTNKLLIISKLPLDQLQGEHGFGGGFINDVIIYPYNKAICQAVVIEVPEMEPREVSYTELLNVDSIRGAGKYGSSGK